MTRDFWECLLFGFLATGLFFAWPYVSKAGDTFRPVVSYDLSVSTTANTAPNSILPHTKAIRVVCTTACGVAMAVSPIVASASEAMYVPANVPLTVRAHPGTHIYVQAPSGSGNLFITELE